MRRPRTGAETTVDTDASKAAGDAAYDEALKAEWPPTRGNAQAVGAAAGGAAAAAVCTAYGAGAAAPLCATIGAKVGEFVGGVVYDVADRIFGGGPDLTRLLLDKLKRRALIEVELARAGYRLMHLAHPEWDHIQFTAATEAAIRNAVINQGTVTYATVARYEVDNMHRDWGLPKGRGYTWELTSDAQVSHMLRMLAAAEAGRGGQIIAANTTVAEASTETDDSSGGAVVAIGAVMGLGYLAAKLWL